MSRVAVVTGGASGVGLAISRQLAVRGHRIAVLDRDGAAAEQVALGLRDDGAEARAFPVDVADRAAVESTFGAVRSALGPVNVLVTSAAVSGFTTLEDISWEEWDQYLAVNLSGTFHCMKLALPDMVAAGWGRIVTISSAAGQTGVARQTHYSATKGGVIALTKAVAKEFAGRGITANSLPPFAVETPMLRHARESGNLPAAEVLTRMIPAGRVGTPDDLAATCAFLCSDEAGYLNGQVIGVNGGAVT